MDIIIREGIKITNPELKKITTDIKKASANVIGNTFKIASLIATVEKDELYIEDGFDDVFDYVKQCFGLEKTSTYNLIRVGRDFIHAVESGKVTNFETLLTHGSRDYSISQVFKMLPLGIDKAKELTADGVIDETMSCRQIEKIVKENVHGTKEKKPEPETEPENEPEIDEIEDEIIQCKWDDIPEEFKEWFKKNYNFDDFNEIREIDII